jgi:drug/metabolite transporter (DMT)-like permease
MIRPATAEGFAAILLWSTTIAFTRSLAGQLGPMTAAAAVYSVSGVAAIIVFALRRERIKEIRKLPRLYLVVCGALFISYMALLFWAVGFADDRQQVLEVGLLNYLWPVLTLIFTVVLLKKRARPTLYPALLLTIAGIFLVLTQGRSVTWQSFSSNLLQNPGAYTMAFAAAVIWSLYSVLTRKLAGGRSSGAVMLFLPVTAIVFLIACFFFDEPRQWSTRAWLETVFLGLATFLAYSLWDNAMRKGDIVLVASASYLTPLFSTIVSCIYLAISPDPLLWVGCGLLIAGSVISGFSVIDTPKGVG